MAQLSNTFEGGSNGTTITTGNSGGVSGDAFNLINIDAPGSGGAITFDNTHVHSGSLAAKFLTPSVSGFEYVEWDPAAATNFFGRFYIYPAQSFIGGDWIFDGGSGGADKAVIAMDGSDRVTIVDASITVKATSTSSMTINAWNRIEFHVVCSTTVGTMEVKMFWGANCDGTTPDETLNASSLNTGASINQHLFGMIDTGGHNNASAWFDDVVMNASAYPGPAVIPVTVFRPHRMPLGV